MNWSLQWGSRIEALILIQEQTGETPPALASRPQLSQFEQPYFDAYQTVSASRNWTAAGPAAIPLSEIVAYFDIYEINDPEERDDYIAMIRHLDSVYLAYTSAKKGS